MNRYISDAQDVKIRVKQPTPLDVSAILMNPHLIKILSESYDPEIDCNAKLSKEGVESKHFTLNTRDLVSRQLNMPQQKNKLTTAFTSVTMDKQIDRSSIEELLHHVYDANKQRKISKRNLISQVIRTYYKNDEEQMKKILLITIQQIMRKRMIQLLKKDKAKI